MKRSLSGPHPANQRRDQHEFTGGAEKGLNAGLPVWTVDGGRSARQNPPPGRRRHTHCFAAVSSTRSSQPGKQVLVLASGSQLDTTIAPVFPVPNHQLPSNHAVLRHGRRSRVLFRRAAAAPARWKKRGCAHLGPVSITRWIAAGGHGQICRGRSTLGQQRQRVAVSRAGLPATG